MRIARRNIVLSLLGFTAAHVLGLKNAWAMRPGPALIDQLADQLATLVPHPKSARLIGEAYLAVKPQEADVSTLIKLLCPKLNGASLNEAGLNRSGLQTPPRSQLRRLLAAQRSEDFSEGRIIRLGGWIVATTEARLCALVAVHSPYAMPRRFS